MSVVQGVVGKINSRDTASGGKAYSFVLKNQSRWYSVGFTAPTFKEGDSIQFVETQRGNYFDAKDVVPWQGSGVQQAPPVARSVAGGAWRGRAAGPKDQAKDKYWEDKAKTDVVTQRRIEIQAARNAAIETSKLLLEHGLITVPEKTKKQDGKQYLEALINELTDSFIDNTSNRLGMASVHEDGAGDDTQSVEVEQQGEWE